MSNQAIHTESAPAAIGPYSQAVRAGNLLFVSGQIPLDPATGQLIPQDTIQDQTARVLENLKAILAQAGATLDNVVKTTVFLKDMEDFVEMNRVYKTFFAADCPARRPHMGEISPPGRFFPKKACISCGFMLSLFPRPEPCRGLL